MIQQRAWFWVLITVLFLYSCRSDKQEMLTVAVASNLQFVIPVLVNKFSDKTGIDCEVIIGSSGKLTAQIVEGAPFDVFLSADEKYPKELFSKGFTMSEPDIYAYGSLILWTLKDNVSADLSTLQSQKIKFVAIGNPKTAPYGIAALQVLEKEGLFKNLNDKIVFGESISQTNQFIISQAAEIGFTSKSVVLSSQMKNKGTWKEIDKGLYDPMAQALVILNTRSKFQQEALQFRDYILSAEGKEILAKFGYELNP